MSPPITIWYTFWDRARHLQNNNSRCLKQSSDSLTRQQHSIVSTLVVISSDEDTGNQSVASRTRSQWARQRTNHTHRTADQKWHKRPSPDIPTHKWQSLNWFTWQTTSTSKTITPLLWISHLWVGHRMRKLIMGHVEALLIHLLIQILNGVHLKMIVKTKRQGHID